jgi:hypothetical protein
MCATLKFASCSNKHAKIAKHTMQSLQPYMAIECNQEEDRNVYFLSKRES